ncbi:hypothetical protein Aduo_011883 [Ancylostoma duodenale]
MSEFTEEQLLCTSPPRDDYMEQDSEHDGSNVSTDPKVQELTKKITMLGHSGSQPDVESRGGYPSVDDLQAWDAHVLLAVAQGTKAAATCTWGTVSGAFQATNGLFGQKSVTDIGIMGKKVQALLDTGSEMSIVPLSVFRTARAEGIDLDDYVERVPKIDAVIRNASGTIMNFADTIRMDVTLRNRTKPVAFHVGEGFGDVVILGTNALETFGIRLSMDMDGEVPEVDRPQKVAVVKERIFIPSGSTKTVTLEGDVVRGDYLLCATHPLVEDSLCSVTEDGIANVTVCNDSGEHRYSTKEK